MRKIAGANACAKDICDCSCRGCGPRMGVLAGGDKRCMYTISRISKGRLRNGGRVLGVAGGVTGSSTVKGLGSGCGSLAYA